MVWSDGGPAGAAVSRARPPHPSTRSTTIEQPHRLNAEIKVPRVRLIDADGEQVGIVPLARALRSAREADLDLVEVAPQADPPVCRIMDYGKHRYEQGQKEKEARKRQSQIVIKEIKMRPKISDNDYGTKSGHVRRFLVDGAKVKATIMFRGRELTHTELGQRLLDRLAKDMEDLATIEAYPKVDGRNMIMVLAPIKKRERPVTTAQEALGDDIGNPDDPATPDTDAASGADADPSADAEVAAEADVDAASEAEPAVEPVEA